eukprot:g58347.t1
MFLYCPKGDCESTIVMISQVWRVDLSEKMGENLQGKIVFCPDMFLCLTFLTNKSSQDQLCFLLSNFYLTNPKTSPKTKVRRALPEATLADKDSFQFRYLLAQEAESRGVAEAARRFLRSDFSIHFNLRIYEEHTQALMVVIVTKRSLRRLKSPWSGLFFSCEKQIPIFKTLRWCAC